MKNRFLYIAIAAVVILSAFILIRFIKKWSVDKAQQLEVMEENEKQKAGQLIDVDSYLKEADALTENGALLEARQKYQKLMETSLPSEQMTLAQSKLENINIRLLLSGILINHSEIYEVKPGDVLIQIAKKFNTTVDAIAKANNIKENLIHPGMKLRVLNGKFNINVDKSQNILALKYEDELIKTYNVSTGKNNSTPIGTFKIINKLVNPVWYKEGKAIPPSSPENILGSRWMGFNLPEYGIHGTTVPQDIGKQVTDGCVRLKNEDVEEIYSIIPVGTEVNIVD